MTTGTDRTAGVGPPGGRRVRLVAARAPAPPPTLDPDQQAVVDRVTGSGPLVVTGAPGTGKTLTVVESVVARVRRDGLDPGSVLVLAPSRRTAAALRDRISLRLAEFGSPAMREPLARTPPSYAFGLIRRFSQREGLPVPRLISGPEQDDILGDLLAGHLAGDGRRPSWPEDLRDALRLNGFRHELRDLLMRALERGLLPEQLEALGHRHRRPFWRAAAQVFAEYLEVTALATPGGYDPAALVDHAAALLDRDDDLLAAERARLRFVAVDDHQESGEALARLLDQVSGQGADLLLVGDPDATTEGFRGATPQLIAQAPARYPARDGTPAPVRVLGTGWRLDPVLAQVAARAVAGIGALGPAAAQRRSVLRPTRPGAGSRDDDEAPQDPDRVRVAILRSGASEAAYIAEHLRRAHLTGGMAWERMAVIVRSGAQAAALSRSLSQAGVPITQQAAVLPLRDEPAVRTLAGAVRAAAALGAPARAGGPDARELTDQLTVLLREIGGLDPLTIARLTRTLTLQAQQELTAADAAAVLVRLLRDPDGALHLLDPRTGQAVQRVAQVLSAGGRALAARQAPDAVLWAVWQATGLERVWWQQALEGGRRGRRADRDLDALMTLFALAERFAERSPGADILVLLDRIDRQDLPEDSVADHSPASDTVTLATPQQTVGSEWDLVVVAGVQEGIWPNTRLRGSLLDAPGLVDVVSGRELTAAAGRRAAHAAVMHDELRMFHVALTRSRGTLLVTAVSDADLVPSDLVGLVAPDLPEPEQALRPVPRPMSLAGVVAHTRSILLAALEAGDTTRADRAAALLAALARERVPGADPGGWYRTGGWSDTGPLSRPGEVVQVSPSAIQTHQRCPLRWMLTGRAGASTPAPPAVALGTLVHDLAHTMADAPLEDLLSALRARWDEVDAPDGWLGDQLFGRGRAMLVKFDAYREREGAGQVLAQEVPVNVPLTGPNGEPLVLRGQIDRVEDAGEGAVSVVDLKTGRDAVPRAELPRHPQLGAYQVAVDHGALDEVLGHPVHSAGARLVHLGTTTQSFGEQTQPALVRDEDPDWAHDLVRAAGSGMAGSSFPATVSTACRHCPVRSSCPLQPEGRQL